MGEAKQRREALAAGKPWDADQHRLDGQGLPLLAMPPFEPTLGRVAGLCHSEGLEVIVVNDPCSAYSERRRSAEFMRDIESILKPPVVVMKGRRFVVAGNHLRDQVKLLAPRTTVKAVRRKKRAK